ncbi:MAG: ATP-binding protein [Candidatus Palauibacterales bacterium]|nr:ATP-binding protein [Candidatus Palauibacterales bacterium]MDP2528348.1 ATP-binding protein [Candidatus Palauibacterales bacterium]MDP2584386.1 ATP-binding protein [Candidatus Palauibacterales bacterium]
MIRSFRFQLTLRFTATMTAAIVAFAGLGYWALRQTLDRQIDASVLNVASIQASSVTSAPNGGMHFQEWNLTPEEAASLRDLIRYAEVWDESGRHLLRSQFLTRDLPLDTAALERAADGQLTWTEDRLGDTEIRALYYPLGRLGSRHARHVLEVAAPLTSRNRTLHRAALYLLTIVVLVSGGTYLGSWWLAGRAVRPVRDITSQAEAIGASTLGRRIGAHADTHEYERLVHVLNTMLDRLDAAFEAQRRFTSDASHELRSPLTALRGELELALRRVRDPEEYRRVLASALEEAERLSELSEDLLTLARSDAGVVEARVRRVDVTTALERTVERHQPRADEKDIRLGAAMEPGLAGACDPDLLDRMLSNLIDNALKFTSAGGRVDVSARFDGHELVLEVADTGPGIREGDLGRIFDRFYRADAARTSTEGTGLGLSIVRTATEAHGGDVMATNRPEGGALFTVRLPVRDQEA